MIRFATFLSFSLKSPSTMQNYIFTICTLNELGGYGKSVVGIRFRNALRGISRKLQHVAKQATPITLEILKRILKVVNLQDQKQLACWVALVLGFHLFLRKNNVVPDTEKELSSSHLRRMDFAFHDGLLMATIVQTKTIQFSERELQMPIIENKSLDICPVYWFLNLVNSVQAKPFYHAFSYYTGRHMRVLTAKVLLQQSRTWLTFIGENANEFTLHSLRRRVASYAFQKNLPALYIKMLGDWQSDAYIKYIDSALRDRIDAWRLFAF